MKDGRWKIEDWSWLGPVALNDLFDTGVLLLHDLLTSSIKDFGNIYS
jgi:hypothetical protein